MDNSQSMNMPDGKFAWTAKIGEKGQIVIPKEARELFHLKPGDTIMLLGDRERGIAIVNTASYMPLFNHIFGSNTEAEDTTKRDDKK